MHDAQATTINEDPHAADEVRSALLNPLIVDGRPVHPAAAAFPRINDHDREQMRASIRMHGLHELPTVDSEGQVLDGVSRIDVCHELGIPYDVTIYDGDPVAFVIAKNLTRRHMKPGQRAAIADEIARLPRHRPAGVSKVHTQSEAAEMMGVSRATVQRVASVRLRGREDLVQAVAAGDITPTEAVDIADGKKTKSGTGDEWYSDTPFLSLCREIMGLSPDQKIDFDPFSCEKANERVRAKHYFTKEDDALDSATKWPEHVETAFMNAPNSKTTLCVQRWLAWHDAGGTVHSMQIGNAAMGDKWVQDALIDAALDKIVVCFPASRYAFVDGDGVKAGSGGRSGQIVIYRGPDKARARNLLNGYVNLATKERKTDRIEGTGFVVPTKYN